MARLPAMSGREVVKAFKLFGWTQVRQNGSHMILVRDNHPATPSIPDHK